MGPLAAGRLAEPQSAGVGSALLRAALDYGAGARGGIILASEDPRALRAYWRAGFTLRPCFDARGPLQTRAEPPAAVREGRWPEDADMVDATARAVRGAGASIDVTAGLAAGSRLLVHEAGGYALATASGVRTVAGQTETAARELLRAALLATTKPPAVDFIDAQQDWAFDEVLAAGMELRSSGAVAVRGDVGPMRPYIPSGAYL